MKFKLEYTIRDLRLEDGSEFRFNCGGPHSVMVSLRQPTSNEQAIGHLPENAFCTATSSWAPNADVSDVFERIAANTILRGVDEDDALAVSQAYDSPDGKRIRIPSMAKFPQHFQSFANAVNRELVDATRRTTLVLMWRADLEGHHNPFSSRGLHWSTDGTFWHPMPSIYSVRVHVIRSLRVSDAIQNDVQAIVASGATAPIYQDLFLEAWEQRRTNPRSAIVIGMAAAELAVKRCIAELVPKAEWLATNVPSPPLERMLREYLPLLPARCLIGGTVRQPPATVMEILKKGVIIRNQLAHAGSTSPTADTAEEILRAVRDVLWLLDYYCGQEWALGHLTAPTRDALQNPRNAGSP
jgi:hypothetical protein